MSSVVVVVDGAAIEVAVVDVAIDVQVAGAPGPQSTDTTWTFIGPTDPGDPSTLPNPMGLTNRPLWVDTDEFYTGDGGDVDWIVPVLLNGWVDYTVGSTQRTQYRRTSGGLVQVAGKVAPGRLGSAIFQFPPGYRTNTALTFNAICETGYCRIDLLPTGDLVHVSGDPGAWVSLSGISFYGETGTDGGGEEEDDMYGEHIITWTGTAWIYRGNEVVARPATIPSYAMGSRAVWDTSMDDTVTTPPPLAVVGDVWFPHGDVDPTA